MKLSIYAAFALMSLMPSSAQQDVFRPPSGPTPRMRSGKVDLSGVWQKPYVPDMTKDGTDQKGMPELPFTPWGEAEWKKYDAAEGDYTGACLPFGLTRAVNTPEPMQLMQSDTYLAFLFEQNSWFVAVPIDGRPHRKGIAPWFGDSVGHWEGDTLVVDTVSFNGKTRLDTVGHPHSDQLHVIQRVSRPDLGHISYEVTIDDPKTFTKPWKNARTFTLRPDWEILEYSCEENNKSLWEGRIKVPKFFAGAADGAEIKVMISGGFTAAYLDLASEFERTTNNTVVTSRGASMGTAPDAIPSRLQRGEPVDVLIMAGEALDGLIKQGKVVAGTRVDLARSRIGVAVRAGAPKPDIRSVDAFTRALLDAKSIAYSASASGVYLSTELFQRLGIADRIMSKSKMIESEPVGAVVARGEAEIGLQQISELLPVPGIDYVGPLPSQIQKVTVFSAGIAVGAKNTDAAKAFIKFLASAAAAPAIAKSALEPMTPTEHE